MTRREWALKVLGLDSSATESDMRVAYRDLVAVWHPDRYSGNERLRGRAEEMMKRLNAARDILRGADPGSGWVADSAGWEDLPPEPPAPPTPPPPPDPPHPDPPPDPPSEPSDDHQTPRSGTWANARRAAMWIGAASLSGSLLWAAFGWRREAPPVALGDSPAPTVDVKPTESPPKQSDLPPGVSATAEGATPDTGRILLGKLGQAVKATDIRSAPGGRVYYRVKPYEYLVLKTSDKPNHYKVLLQNGKDGYVASDAVAKLPYDVTAPAPLGKRVAEAALARVGQTSSSLANGGLVNAVWRDVGLEDLGPIARHSQRGESVKRLEDLVVGDRLYFWDNSKDRIADAGIYLGKGYMAWFNPSLKRVSVDYLGTKPLLKRLISARRSPSD